MNQIAPQLFSLAKNLKLLYQKIDSIDVCVLIFIFLLILLIKEYVNFVGNRVIDLEKKVNEIEKQDSTSFFSFFGSKPKNVPIEVCSYRFVLKNFHFQFIPSNYYLNPGLLISKIEEINKKKETIPKKQFEKEVQVEQKKPIQQQQQSQSLQIQQSEQNQQIELEGNENVIENKLEKEEEKEEIKNKQEDEEEEGELKMNEMDEDTNNMNQEINENEEIPQIVQQGVENEGEETEEESDED